MFSCKTRNLISTFIMCFFLFSSVLNGQKSGFRNYGAEYGIPDGFVYTINQSDDGFLWVGTGSGIARFDGYNYYKVIYPDSVESRNPQVSYKDNRGTIWFGCNDGTVFYSEGSTLKKLNLTNSRSISQILQGPDNLLYIVPQGSAIFRLDISKPDTAIGLPIPEEHTLFSAQFDDEGNLLAGTQGSILMLETGKDTVIIRGTIEGFDYSSVTSICHVETGIMAGTEDNGIFFLGAENGYKPDRITGHPEYSTLSVKSIFEDQEKRIWISTFGSGVIQFRLDRNGIVTSVHRYNSSTGLSSDDVRLVFCDIENNYWFGLFGQGLSKLVSYAFGFYSPGKLILKTT